MYTGSESDSEKKVLQEGLYWTSYMDAMEKNHLLYVDNFYTSPELLLDLLKYTVLVLFARITSIFLKSWFLLINQWDWVLTDLHPLKISP